MTELFADDRNAVYTNCNLEDTLRGQSYGRFAWHDRVQAFAAPKRRESMHTWQASQLRRGTCALGRYSFSTYVRSQSDWIQRAIACTRYASSRTKRSRLDRAAPLSTVLSIARPTAPKGTA